MTIFGRLLLVQVFGLTQQINKTENYDKRTKYNVI